MSSRAAQRARLANVTGALLLTHRADSEASLAAAISVAESYCGLFEETLIVGGAPAESWPGTRVDDPDGSQGELHSLLAAWEASTSERVVVADSDAAGCCADLILALTAWPESDAVVVSDPVGGDVLCSSFLRSRCIQVAQEALSGGDATRSGFLSVLGRVGKVEALTVDRMQLSDWRDRVNMIDWAD